MTDDEPASSTREIPGGYAPRGAGAAAIPVARYLTLAAARAIECNGCGDSGRSDGFWTWGQLPESQYRALNQGAPLIIPVERGDGSWRDRAWTAQDANELGPTLCRCAAFAPRSDSGGACGLHDQTRPPKCGALSGRKRRSGPLARPGRRGLAADGRLPPLQLVPHPRRCGHCRPADPGLGRR